MSEKTKRSVRDAAQPTRIQAPKELDERLILLTESDSERAASFRLLRHRLQTECGNPKTIGITSPLRGEGKSTCAVNLALALSEAGRARVALVEANFRRPQLAKIFGFEPAPCFSEQLEAHRKDRDAPWGVVEMYSPHLHVLALASSVRRRPLVDGPLFSLAIGSLKQAGYDYIVVDAAQVIGQADALVVQESVENMLLVARSGQTPGRDLREAIDQLGNQKMAGVMLLE
jgi:Mrp family chromosome partitioning ATPase